MKLPKANWQLKNIAKDTLRGQYSEAVLLTLIYGLFFIATGVMDIFIMYSLSGSDNLLTGILFADYTPNSYLASLAFSFLTAFLLNVLKAGINLFYLNMACGQTYSLRDMFHAFRNQPGKFAAISLVLVSVQFFCSLPGYACNYFYLLNPAEQWTTLANICGFVGQLVALPVTMGLSQCLRLLLDYPSLSAVDALKKGWQLMNRHKLRFFGLTLSFLPLEIAAVFTCGIGFLWLSPYMNMTYTLFYLDRMDSTNL